MTVPDVGYDVGTVWVKFAGVLHVADPVEASSSLCILEFISLMLRSRLWVTMWMSKCH